jgi:LemA protein
MVQEAFSTMDVYLKKRWDLVPNIVETVKGYAKHEKETLENVINLRNSAYDYMSPDAKIDAGEKLKAGISKLIMLAESYPDLKANQNFLNLSSQLTKVEEDIANSRKYYNAVARDINNKVQMFPSNIIAGLFGFKEIKMFDTLEAERERVKVEFK